MIAQPIPTTTMAVIDSDLAGYDALVNSQPASLRFLSSGREALRLAATERIAVWWIGVDLSDMSGFDLYDMLRQRFDDVTVCMVGATYRSEDDSLARRVGAAMYVCKPVDTCWLPPPVDPAELPEIVEPMKVASILNATPPPDIAALLSEIVELTTTSVPLTRIPPPSLPVAVLSRTVL